MQVGDDNPRRLQTIQGWAPTTSGVVTMTSLQWASACKVSTDGCPVATRADRYGAVDLVGRAECDDDDLVLARPAATARWHVRVAARSKGATIEAAVIIRTRRRPTNMRSRSRLSAKERSRRQWVGRLDSVGEGIGEQTERSRHRIGGATLDRVHDPTASSGNAWRKSSIALGGGRARAWTRGAMGSTSGSTRSPGSRRPGASFPSSVARRVRSQQGERQRRLEVLAAEVLVEAEKSVALEQVLAVPRTQAGSPRRSDGDAPPNEARSERAHLPATAASRGRRLRTATRIVRRSRRPTRMLAADDEPGPARPQHVAGAVDPRVVDRVLGR